MHIQRARSTAGRLLHAIESLSRDHQDALVVWGESSVNATLWKVFVLMLLLTLTSNRMVSVLLK